MCKDGRKFKKEVEIVRRYNERLVALYPRLSETRFYDDGVFDLLFRCGRAKARSSNSWKRK